MFWKSKRKEPFSFQSLTDVEREHLTRCLKDEVKELVESSGEIEKMLNGMNWATINGDENIDFRYRFNINLPALRLMIRGIRK